MFKLMHKKIITILCYFFSMIILTEMAYYKAGQAHVGPIMEVYIGPNKEIL